MEETLICIDARSACDFLQCLHRLFEEKAAVHGYGGLNYFLTIVAILIRAAFELKKGTVSSAVTTILSTYLELVMDWGLLRRHSKNAYLRDKLLVPHKSVYFAAMVMSSDRNFGVPIFFQS